MTPASPADSPRAKQSPDWLLMVSKFLAKGSSVASVAPSSPYLSRCMLKGIDFEAAQCLVELGAGTGPVTEQLVRRVRPHTKLVIVELDPDFCKRLRQKFPTVDVVEGDAAQLDKLLADRGISQVDHVLSGLPIPSIPVPVRDAIIASSARALLPGGSFRQLTIMPLVFRKLYRQYFEDVKFRFVPANIPPAGVYICKGYNPRPPKKG